MTVQRVIIPLMLGTAVTLCNLQAGRESANGQTTGKLPTEASHELSVVDTLFEFSNGKSVRLSARVELEIEEGKQVLSNCRLYDLETGKFLFVDDWQSVGCEFSFESNKLHVGQLEPFAMGEDHAFVYIPWKVYSFYYENGSFKQIDRFNRDIRFDKPTIDALLKEYELTEWRTQEEDVKYVEETLMNLANRLLIAAISGSKESEAYFREFETKAKPDGAFASWYLIMEDMLEYAKEN